VKPSERKNTKAKKDGKKGKKTDVNNQPNKSAKACVGHEKNAMDTDQNAAAAKRKRTLKPLRSATIVARGTLGPAAAPLAKRKPKTYVPGGKKRKGDDATKRHGNVDVDAAKGTKSQSLDQDPWSSQHVEEETRRLRRFRARLAKKKKAAVDVDAPGCAFNPEYEAHQDALGQAVSEIMVKEYQKELKPVRPVAFLKPEEMERQLLEEGMMHSETDESSGGEDGEQDTEQPKVDSRKAEKKTRAEINRKRRHKQRLREEEEKSMAKRLKAAMRNIKKVKEEVELDLEEKERRRIRTQIAREERRKRVPARLGKVKYVPEPTQVLLTEEVSGSLRRTRGVPTLLRDRFKSLQRRELIEPRKKQPRQRIRRKVVERGSRGEAAREAAGVPSW